jgi:deoxyribonuclease-4
VGLTFLHGLEDTPFAQKGKSVAVPDGSFEMTPPKKIKSRNKGEKTILLGAHFSIAGGLHRALMTASEYGCPVVQLFTKNASTWKERTLTPEDMEEFNRRKEGCGIRFVCSHAGYLINLASPDQGQHAKSIEALGQELIRSSQLEIPYVVVHPGAHMGMGVDKGLRRVAEGINAVFDRTPGAASNLLLETTAGQGTGLGHTFEHLAAISAMVEPEERVGFCLDTCHVFGAGYDLRTKKTYEKTMAAFERTLGLKGLHVIHVNDAKKDLGSRVDRHEHIGQGRIGINAFRFLMNDPRLKTIPKILETPKGHVPVDQDRLNLERLRALVQN